MIALNTGDKIRGDAAAANEVDYSIFGFVGTAATPIADGQLPSSIGDLYTSGSDGIGVSSIVLVSSGSLGRAVNLYRTPSGGPARRLIPKDYSLPAGYSLHTDGKSVSVFPGDEAPVHASYVTIDVESELSAEYVLGTAVIMRGAAAGKPAASKAGLIYVESDGSFIVWRDNGASWNEIARGEAGIRLAQLAEKAHASTTGRTSDDHHTEDHAARHENAGGDEISVAGLSGELADNQPPKAHKASHENGDGDEISVAGLSGELADNQPPKAHKASHENGGGDEISVAALSGELADNQPPKAHDLGGAKHGADTLANLNAKVSDGTLDKNTDKRPPSQGQFSITVEDPSDSENICLGFTFPAITITEVQAVVVGSSPSVTIDPSHSTDRSAAGNDILNAPVAITNTTVGQNLTNFDDPTIPADSWLWLLTTAKSGTVDELTVTIKYTVD